MSTNLRLMVDYDLLDAVEGLHSLSALDVKTTLECGFKPHSRDSELIWNGTIKEKRILLTADMNTIKPSRYPPCNHGGIIIIQHPRPTPKLVHDYMKVLLQSGVRQYAKKHFTHINRNRLKILTHKDPVVVEFNTKPKLRKIINRA